jgi:hypothetical protein
VILKDNVLSAIFKRSKDQEEYIRLIYGTVLTVAGVDPQKFKKNNGGFTSSAATNEAIHRYAIMWDSMNTNVRVPGFKWLVYEFQVDDTLGPMIIEVDKDKIELEE